jgi:protoheme IX farnesyltransferase
VGAVPGAIPPMIGVAAADGMIGTLGWSLFAILFVWQMPHFFGLATLYRDDYARGGFRMLPGETDGQRRTARQVVLFSALLLPISLSPVVADGIGWFYAAAALPLGLWFLAAGLRMGRSPGRPEARRLFIVSILYLPLLLLAMVADRSF